MTNRVMLAAGALAVVAACLFRVWIHQSVIAAGYAISQARGEARELTKEKKALEVELTSLRSPDRLKNEAPSLGLVPMAPQQLYVVKVEAGR
ncbi:MAG: hypothetical protein AAFX94_11135 [Myxococcota bacterium]